MPGAATKPARKRSVVNYPPTLEHGVFTLQEGADALWVLAGLFNQEHLLGPVVALALHDIEHNLTAIKCNGIHEDCPVHGHDYTKPCPGTTNRWGFTG